MVFNPDKDPGKRWEVAALAATALSLAPTIGLLGFADVQQLQGHTAPDWSNSIFSTPSLFALNHVYTTDRPTQVATLTTPAVGFAARTFRRSLPIKDGESLALWRLKNNSFGIPFTLASGLIGVGVGLHVNDSQLATHSFIGLVTPSAIGVGLTAGNAIDHLIILASDTDMRYNKDSHTFNQVNKRILHWT